MRSGELLSDRPQPYLESPRVLYGLLAVNVIVYVAWQVAQTDIAVRSIMGQHFLVSAERVQQGAVWTLLTSAFSHVDPMHLFANMLALYVFGRAVYQIIGPRGMVHLYVAGALVASLGHVAWSLISGDPTSALGASGSVMAIAVVYGACFPKNVLLINFIVPVPAAIAVAGYLLYDVWGVFTGADGIAHAAHLGGALYGFIYWAVVARPLLKYLLSQQPAA